MEITVSRALTELKTLNTRIEKKVNEAQFIYGCKQSSKKVDGIQTREEFGQNAKSQYDSIVDLIDRRNEIKTKIVQSNAETKVKVGDYEYTVAEAIERKSSIELDKLLLNKMKQQYNFVLIDVQRKNDQVDAQLNEHLTTVFGAEVKQKEDSTLLTENFRKQHGYEIVDPLKLKDKIDKLEKEIEDFETEVDAVLSESNAINKITISD